MGNAMEFANKNTSHCKILKLFLRKRISKKKSIQ